MQDITTPLAVLGSIVTLIQTQRGNGHHRRTTISVTRVTTVNNSVNDRLLNEEHTLKPLHNITVYTRGNTNYIVSDRSNKGINVRNFSSRRTTASHLLMSL